MKKTITEKSLYNLCAEKGYFNYGDSELFKKVLYLNEIEAPAEDIAIAIWTLSSNVELRVITKEVRKLVYNQNLQKKIKFVKRKKF